VRACVHVCVCVCACVLCCRPGMQCLRRSTLTSRPYLHAPQMDEILAGVADTIKNFAVIFLVDTSEVGCRRVDTVHGAAQPFSPAQAHLTNPTGCQSGPFLTHVSPNAHPRCSRCPTSTPCTSCTTPAPRCSSSGACVSSLCCAPTCLLRSSFCQLARAACVRLLCLCCRRQKGCKKAARQPAGGHTLHAPRPTCRNKHIMIDLGTGNNNKVSWAMSDKQEFIDIVEVIYRGARKGRGLVVSPKDYSTKYRCVAGVWVCVCVWGGIGAVCGWPPSSLCIISGACCTPCALPTLP